MARSTIHRQEDRALLTFLKEKKREEAKRIISKGVDLTAIDNTGNSALTWAAQTNSDEIVKLLINHESLDIHTALNFSSLENGYTALIWACRKNCTETVSELLLHGADPVAVAKDSTFPLYWAVKNNNTVTAKLLFRHATNPIDLLLNWNTGIEIRHFWEIIIRNDRHEMAEILLAHGANPNTSFATKYTKRKQTKKEEWTPLLLACRRNRTRLALLFAQKGGKLHIENKDGNVPLMSAILHKNSDLLFGLMRFGADPLLGGRQKGSPFLKACSLGYLGIIVLILRHKTILCSHIENAILTMMIDSKRPKVVDLLLKHGGNVRDVFERHKVSGKDFTDIDLALLVRAGLDEGKVLERLVYASSKKGFRWLLKLVAKSNPYLLRLSNLYYELSEHLSDADQKIKGADRKKKRKMIRDRKNFLAELNELAHQPPTLLEISIRTLRSLFADSNRGGNVLAILYQNLEVCSIVPLRIRNLLSLQECIPKEFARNIDSYQTASGEIQIDYGVDEYRSDLEEQHIENVQIPREYKERFMKDVCQRDIPKWGLVEPREKMNYLQDLFSSKLSQSIQNAPLLDCFIGITDICLNKDTLTNEPEIINDSVTEILDKMDRYLSIETVNPSKDVETIMKMTQRFLNLVLYKLKEDHGLEFSLFPCGSVHVGNKVGFFDELDYVLRWKITDKVRIREDQTGRLLATLTSSCEEVKGGLKEFLYTFIRDYIGQWRESFEKCGLIIDACYMYSQAPAVCLRLSWGCHRGHNHIISVDLTPSIIFTGECLGSFYHRLDTNGEENKFHEIISTLLEAPLSLVSTEGLIIDEGSHVSSPWKVSTNVCDWLLFQMLDEISTNVRKVYKILKIFRDKEFPKVMKYSEKNELFDHRWKEGQLVSSHILKNIVLEEVETHPDAESWELSLLKERVLSCLERIRDDHYKLAITGEHCHIVQRRGLEFNHKHRLCRCLAEDASFLMEIINNDEVNELVKYLDTDSESGNNVLVLNLFSGENKGVCLLQTALGTLRQNPEDVRKKLHLKKSADIYVYGPNSRRKHTL